MAASNIPKRRAQLQIEDVAFGGAGVARARGKIVFVPLTIDGEEVEVQLVEQRRKFNRAELRKVLRSSSERVEPPCAYFGRCGGCDYQHITYKHQLEIKQHQVGELLKRVGHLTNVPVSPMVPCRNPYGFRNRITVHAEQGRLGFFSKNSRKVVDVERCEIAAPELNEKLQQLRKEGLSDGSHRTLRQEGVPLTFTQTNNFVASILLEYISTRLEGEVLLDAYCGSGFFSHPFAGHFKKIVGLDWNAHAIARARAVAAPNEQYICANVSDVIAAVLAEHGPQTVVLDPPSDGIGKQVAYALAAARPKRLIYVSCNPATLARDLSSLSESLEVKSVQPFDMFPQSAAIETVAVLDRRARRSHPAGSGMRSSR